MNSPLVSTVVEPFLNAARVEERLNGESLTQYRAAIGNFVRTIGDLPIDQVSPHVFVELKQRLRGRGVGPSFTNTIIHAIKHLVHYCGDSLGHAVQDLDTVRPLRIPRVSVTYLTQDEIEQFLSAIHIRTRAGHTNASGLMFRALVETLAGTGMRISEALALNVSDIDWKNQEARIVGKGAKERTVFFSDRSVRWLRRYVEQRTDRCPSLFATSRSHHRLRRHEAERLCRATAARSGSPKRVTLHVLRHTFATTLLRNGCPIGHIQGLLGHERLETTCRYYLGVMNRDELKRAHERFLDW